MADPLHLPKRCGSCMAPVYWAQLPSGKSMPVDAQPTPGGNVRLVDRGGSVLAFVLKGDELDQERAKAKVLGADPGLRVSHFATCVNAAQHRRTR